MGIYPGEPKHATFCTRYFFEHLRIAKVHRGAHGCLLVMGLEREVSRGVALSSGLCLES